MSKHNFIGLFCKFDGTVGLYVSGTDASTALFTHSLLPWRHQGRTQMWQSPSDTTLYTDIHWCVRGLPGQHWLYSPLNDKKLAEELESEDLNSSHGILVAGHILLNYVT